MKQLLLLFTILFTIQLTAQDEVLYPYSNQGNFGLTDGADYDVSIGKVDSISPIPIYSNKNKFYKSFKKSKCALHDKKGKTLAKGFDDYSTLTRTKLAKDLVLIKNKELVGLYDLKRKKVVIKPDYKKIQVLIEDETVFFSLTDGNDALSVVDTNYKQVIAPDSTWRSAYLETLEANGTSKIVINLSDTNYNNFYYDLSGKEIKAPVVDEAIMEDTIVEMVEEDSGYDRYGPICKKNDSITKLNDSYVLKSCKKTKPITIPLGYSIPENALIEEQKNLKSDLIYITYKNKVGIFSITDSEIVVAADHEEIQKLNYTDFLTKEKSKFGLIKITRKYRSNKLEVTTITPNQFNSLEKASFQWSTYSVTLPDTIKGYLTTSADKTTIYLPKKIKDKYGIK